MLCTGCNNALQSADRFCYHCGAPVAHQPALTPTTEPDVTQVTTTVVEEAPTIDVVLPTPARHSFYSRQKAVVLSGVAILLSLLVVTAAMSAQRPATSGDDSLAVASAAEPDLSFLDTPQPTVEPTPSATPEPVYSAPADDTPAYRPVAAAAPAPRCHPNYSGCLDPTASDYDCKGGTGDGPRYVEGPVTISGSDPYGLDGSPKNGVGCEKKAAAAKPKPPAEPDDEEEEVVEPSAAPTDPPSQQCDPNYSGCLDPNASDYDCEGGSGDGPKYTGPVEVKGNDHYGLDSDNDGTGCETS